MRFLPSWPKFVQAEFVMRGTKVELDEMREILKGKQDPSETPRQEAARIAENERRLRHKTESTAELDECLRDSVGSVKMYKEQISDIHTLLRKLEGRFVFCVLSTSVTTILRIDHWERWSKWCICTIWVPDDILGCLSGWPSE